MDPRTKPSVVVPPINFSLVAPGIYRSGHPNKKNFSFLRRLGLRTVVYVEGGDEYRRDSREFVQTEGMKLVRFDLSREEDLFTPLGRAHALKALHTVLDPASHPVLIHDDSGKSASSLLVSLVRRMQRWSLTGIYAEGDMFAGPAGGAEGEGIGEAGREFIALFEPRSFAFEPGTKPDWLD